MLWTSDGVRQPVRNSNPANAGTKNNRLFLILSPFDHDGLAGDSLAGQKAFPSQCNSEKRL